MPFEKVGVMAYVTEALFRDDAYLREAEASGRRASTSAAASSSTGRSSTRRRAASRATPASSSAADGSRIAIAATITGETKDEIIHVPAPAQALPAVGETLSLSIDWERRYRLMRMHTACHLLTVVCPFPITGAAVARGR